MIFLLLVCAPVIARAAEGEFHEIYSLWTIVWVTVWAFFGSLVSYTQRLGRGEIERFSLMEMIGELFTSAFAGWVTFIIAGKSGLDSEIVYCLVGISGHMGARTVFILDTFCGRFYDFVAARFLPSGAREEYDELFHGRKDDENTNDRDHDEGTGRGADPD
ncbi:MAG: phage holin family protein [Oxalobacter formigenes]|nr:phage holin family protein [Oxalobacter formigenes]